jgi:DNA repair exonuclease SbcCD ATPase subunit
MTAENRIVSVEFDINKRIDERVEKILEGESITLPSADAPLVDDYVRKIEGTYDVSRSKEDTDNAIDLLYIAYNTTPQEEGKIRVGIDALMTRLIAAQQDSELKMRGAVTDAGRIIKSLRELFGDWEKARDSDNIQELKGFIGEDLFDLANEIKGRAERISGELTKIAETYDGIIDDTTKATSEGEQALARRLQNKADIEKEIAKNNADRAKLESLVKDLQADITKYEKMANEYKSQAETAEQRAFVMSIVRVGAQMISSTVPAIVQGITTGITGAATGGTSLIAASAVNTARQLVNTETATTDDDKTAEVIEAKKDIAEKNAEKATAEREKIELEKKAKELATEKEKIEGDEETDAGIKAAKLDAVVKRIEANEAEIKDKASQISIAATALNALNASLKSLDENMGKMAEKQEEQATNLRDLQMKMLEKVEAYETEKRTQAAELVKINALLTGQRTDEETIQLAIKSLNLSLKALKRVREIIIEVSFFFKSFADFMQQVMESSGEQSEMIQKAIDRDQLTNSFTRRLKRNTDDFFVTQSADWQAVEIVSAKFVDNFKEGWSKLDKMSGTYLTGDELKSYLNVAAGKIEDISFRRKQASTARLLELNRYRDRISAEV